MVITRPRPESVRAGSFDVQEVLGIYNGKP